MIAPHFSAARVAIGLLPDECSSAWQRMPPEWRRQVCTAAAVSHRVVDLSYEDMSTEVRGRVADRLRSLARAVAPILRGLPP